MQTNSALPKVSYSIAEAVSVTGLGRTSLYAEIGAGRLLASKCGRRTLIPAAALDEWLKSLEATA